MEKEMPPFTYAFAMDAAWAPYILFIIAALIYTPSVWAGIYVVRNEKTAIQKVILILLFIKMPIIAPAVYALAKYFSKKLELA